MLRGLQDAPGLLRVTLDIFLDIFWLHAIPSYNEDDDTEHTHESVRALRSDIDAGDGMIMISPGRSGLAADSDCRLLPRSNAGVSTLG